MVEYALVVAILVVGAVASSEFLTDQADSEVTNQADCVSERPPPPSCQLSPIVTTTTVDPSITTVTTVPTIPPPCGGIDEPPCTTTTTAPIVVPPPPADVVWAGPPTVTGSASSWQIAITVNATSGGAPAPGTSVRVDFIITQPPGAPQTVGCVTDATGSCTITYNVPFSNVTQVEVRHRSTSPGGGTGPGSTWCVPAPGAPAC